MLGQSSKFLLDVNIDTRPESGSSATKEGLEKTWKFLNPDLVLCKIVHSCYALENSVFIKCPLDLKTQLKPKLLDLVPMTNLKPCSNPFLENE